MELKSRIPSGPLEQKWDAHRFNMKLVNPANKRKYSVIVVGAGLAGASAAATMSELGYRVSCFVYHDSPRRAHSIAAQGGINAAKNYQNDGDSIKRLFYDTIKGGDFRAREGNRDGTELDRSYQKCRSSWLRSCICLFLCDRKIGRASCRERVLMPV